MSRCFDIQNVHFKKISEQMADKMEERFSKMEIHGAMKSIDKKKSPSPDGFNGDYINMLWEFIREDIVRFHQNFYVTGSLPSGMYFSFIALIPKTLALKSMNEYRPISLINCTLKILLKLLTTRLNKIMNAIISETQFGFIKRRSIS